MHRHALTWSFTGGFLKVFRVQNKWEIRPCDVTRIKFRCDVKKNFPFWTAGRLLNKIDKSYLMVHSSRKNSFGFRGKITINHILFCPTSSTSHHKIKNVTNHHGNAKCPILQQHMALKRKNIDLSLNLFLTAALLHVLIQSNGSSSLSVEESDRETKTHVMMMTIVTIMLDLVVNKDCLTYEKAIDAIKFCL